MNAKNITIVVPGAGDKKESDAYDIAVQPGHTGEQVVAQLDLSDFVLTKGNGEAVNMSEDLFPLVDDKEKLFTSTPAIVG